MNYKVSVIIPVYNGEKFLRRAIDSVVNQSYDGEYEVLLVDDGSKDGTDAICKEYAERFPFVHYFYHDNRGISKTRERAVELAQGDYLCWVDADDYISTDLLKITMQKIKAANADICVLSWQEVWENGATLNCLRQEDRSAQEWKKQTIAGEFNAVWSYICKREFWNNVKIPWQVCECGEDAYITPILFAKAKNIVPVTEILYYHSCDNPASVTHSYSGIKLLGVGYATYLNFKSARENYPELALQVGKYALRMLTRAYAVATYLKDLDEEKRDLLRSYILDVESHLPHPSFRNKYRVFFIKHRWDRVMALVGKMSLDKKKRQSRKQGK